MKCFAPMPTARIPKSQCYFWTKEWQKKERQAEVAIATGEVLGPFANVDEALRELRIAKTPAGTDA